MITRCSIDELIETFDYVKNDNYFADCLNINNKETFRNSCNNLVDCIVARKNDEIVMVSYVWWNNYKSLSLAGYCRKDFRRSDLSIPAIKVAISEYFKNSNANRIEVFGRNNNRLSRIFTTKCGFKRIGIIPKYMEHNGILEDYYYSIILRG
jgi:RimJ/RimL family protein N-acetyltransferase